MHVAVFRTFYASDCHYATPAVQYESAAERRTIPIEVMRPCARANELPNRKISLFGVSHFRKDSMLS
jgi:hypothetical protein